MKINPTFLEIKDIIKNYNIFLVTTHVCPEGDALGSQLALFEALDKLGKKCIMVNSGNVPARYEFLPHSNEILSFEDYKIVIDKKEEPQVIFYLDCPNSQRAGSVNRIVKKDMVTVNIDHHASNDYFANINCVDSDSSSTCELMFDLFENINISISNSIAVNIYTGILIDTGGFRYDNTSPKTHLVLAKLLQYGVNTNKIFNLIYEQWPVGRYKLLAKVLDTLELKCDGKFAIMTLNQCMLKDTGSTVDLSEDFINYGLSIKGVKITAIFREDNKHIKISFRSKGDLDVNKLASKFDGGGHAKASGCRIIGSLQDAKEEVIKEVAKMIKNSENKK